MNILTEEGVSGILWERILEVIVGTRFLEIKKARAWGENSSCSCCIIWL
jgi:hypothetical protein